MEFFDRVEKIKGMIFDVDGVLTDGKLLLLENGEWLRTMDIKDSFAISHATESRFPLAIITGSDSQAITNRIASLGVENYYNNVDNKASVIEQFMLQFGFHFSEIMYMGDDIPDLPILKLAGLAVCPQDACQEVKAVSHYITQAKGGNGAVREIIEIVMKSKKMWDFTPHR